MTYDSRPESSSDFKHERRYFNEKGTLLRLAGRLAQPGNSRDGANQDWVFLDQGFRMNSIRNICWTPGVVLDFSIPDWITIRFPIDCLRRS